MDCFNILRGIIPLLYTRSKGDTCKEYHVRIHTETEFF
uniref:Uncharacterized protein n=1 Tax=Siphoviridae sp. ctgaY24 TaxID=2827911 RepID=A0A8S5SB33_9CAUD|nr:MAG TPA: hypothetical protein [Siphoviridae sp. ctgaY24]DAU42807.1 MAG TPA: hypothetical protein [Caudoviricetes sp.]